MIGRERVMRQFNYVGDEGKTCVMWSTSTLHNRSHKTQRESTFYLVTGFSDWDCTEFSDSIWCIGFSD